ncbi:MAG: hypothetical protein ACRDWB_00885 [Acidimicrobiales bacterium]
MEVVVDLGSAGVVLHQPDDMAHFALRAVAAHRDEGPSPGALDALAAALADHALGRLDADGTVFIPPDRVRALAERAASDAGHPLSEAWEANFASMIEFAASKGWIASDGAVAAHIEWSYA